MEQPRAEQKSLLEIGEELSAALTALKEKYLRGEAHISEFLSIQNDIQRVLYNQLKLLRPEQYQAEYDEIAVTSITQEGAFYSHLLDKHPVVQAELEMLHQELEFNFWRTAFLKNYSDISLPSQGTASDIFKTVLSHLLREHGQRMNARVITDIELNYILKPKLEPEDYLNAERKMIDDLNS